MLFSHSCKMCSMWALKQLLPTNDILCHLKVSQSIIRHAARRHLSAHLCDIVPHAPCLLVRMLRIFCFSWLAVTWSLCLAALMRWSHIFSSSLRSAAYWAQLDCRRVGGKELNGKPGGNQLCTEFFVGKNITIKPWWGLGLGPTKKKIQKYNYQKKCT